MTEIKERIDGSILLSVAYSNPQGDPDWENRPRQDPYTNQGLITPFGFRRHVRDYLEGNHNLAMWVSRKGLALGSKTQEVALEIGIPKEDKKKGRGKGTASTKSDSKTTRLTAEDEDTLVRALCEKYYDCRAFGGVLANYESRITGPLQIGMGVSVDPIEVIEMSNTLCTIANEKDRDSKDRDMGRFMVVRYGVYRFDFSLSPQQAAKTGFSFEDFRLFLEAAFRSYETSASTGRGNVAVERIDVFRHDSALGNESKASLMRRVKVQSSVDVPSKFEDYIVDVNTDDMEGVTHTTLKGIRDLEKFKVLRSVA